MAIDMSIGVTLHGMFENMVMKKNELLVRMNRNKD